MSNLHILVEAKIEYTKTLTNILSGSLLEGLQSIYEESKSFCDKNRNNKYLIRFQHNLSEIPKWNQSIISDEYNRIITKSNCEWLDDLITAVFISHAKVLTSIKENNTSKTLNLKIPKAEHFIHKCYIECARIFWKNPYFFYDKVSNIEIQKNLREAESIISNTIEETIRKLLPVKTILQEYLGNNFEDDDFDKDDIENLLSNNQKNNVQKMVQKDIDSVLIKNNNDNESKKDNELEVKTDTTDTEHKDNELEVKTDTTDTEHKDNELEVKTESTDTEHKDNELEVKTETTDTKHKDNELEVKTETTDTEHKDNELEKDSNQIKLDLTDELEINNDISELDINEFDKIESNNLNNDINDDITIDEFNIINIDNIDNNKKEIVIDNKLPKVKKIKNANIIKINPDNFYI